MHFLTRFGAAFISLILVAYSNGSGFGIRMVAYSTVPPEHTCDCNQPSVVETPNGLLNVSCDNGICRMSSDVQYPDCYGGVVFSEYGFPVVHRCAQRDPAADVCTRHHLITGWTPRRDLIVGRICDAAITDNCNNESLYVSDLTRLPEELNAAARKCFPASLARLSKRLQLRRNLSENDITCSCSKGIGQKLEIDCVDGRCSDTKENQRNRLLTVWMRIVDWSRAEIAKRYAAIYVYDKDEKTKLLYCAQADYCNANLPNLNGRLYWEMEEIICHWLCPKLKVTSRVKWWQPSVVFFLLAACLCALAAFGVRYFRSAIVV